MQLLDLLSSSQAINLEPLALELALLHSGLVLLSAGETQLRLLDMGCGLGLAAQLAAGRGAQVAGLDAAETSIAIARERTPEGDFRRQSPRCS